MNSHQKRALVTGGAGLIGSHVADLLQREGWTVRVLDNLEPQTHRNGKPAWIQTIVEFIEGDLRDRETISLGAAGHRYRLSPGGLRRLHARDREVRAR